MSTKFERQWSPEEAAEVVRRHVAGESNRAIGQALGRAHTTVARLLASEDMQAVVREEKAKVTEAARGRRRRAADSAERHGARPEVVESIKTGKPPTLRRKAKSKDAADGRLLGLASFDSRTFGDLRYRPNGEVGGKVEERRQERERELDAIERKIVPRPLARVVTVLGTYAYDTRSDADTDRVAALVALDHPGYLLADIKATLRSVEPGRTFSFAEEAPAGEEPTCS